MKPIQFLVFMFQLACILAKFNIKDIVRFIQYYNSVTWEITEHPLLETEIQLFQHVKPNEIQFLPGKAYIVLNIEWIMNFEYQIYYLFSKDSPVSIRHTTLDYVIELRNLLFSKKNKVIKVGGEIPFVREIHMQETYKFRNIFPQTRKNPKIIPPRRLYRISKFNGEVDFQQVPLHFSELNTSDIFIFDYISSLTLFNVGKQNASNADIISAANTIASFIYFENRYEKIPNKHRCRNWMPGKNDCYSKFISKLEGCPEEHYIIQELLQNTVEQIPRKHFVKCGNDSEYPNDKSLPNYFSSTPFDLDMDAVFADRISSTIRMIMYFAHIGMQNVPDYQLYLLQESGMSYIEPFQFKNLEIFDFIPNACYVFEMKNVKEVFIYIRDFANSSHIEKCLKFVEFMSSEYLITIFHKTYSAAPFIFIFKNFRLLISSQAIKETEYIKFFHLKEFIKTELP